MNARALPHGVDCLVVEGPAAFRSRGGGVHPDGKGCAYVRRLILFLRRAASVAERGSARCALERKVNIDHYGDERVGKDRRRAMRLRRGADERLNYDRERDIHHEHGDDGDVREEERGADDGRDEVELLPRAELAHRYQYEIDHCSVKRCEFDHLWRRGAHVCVGIERARRTRKRSRQVEQERARRGSGERDEW